MHNDGVLGRCLVVVTPSSSSRSAPAFLQHSQRPGGPPQLAFLTPRVRVWKLSFCPAEPLSCWAPCPLSRGSLPACQGLGVAATPAQLQIGIMKSKKLQCCKRGENKALKLSLMSLDWLLPKHSSGFLLLSLSGQANSHRNCTEPWNGMD